MKLTTKDVQFLKLQLMYQKEGLSSIIQQCNDYLIDVDIKSDDKDKQAQETILVCTEEIRKITILIDKFDKELENMQ